MQSQPRARAVALATAMVLGFTVFVVTHTARANLIEDDFYEDALVSNRVYDRIYDDLLTDPEFAPQIDSLLGGLNIERADVAATIKAIAKPEYVRALVEAGVTGLVTYFRGRKLEFRLDITPIVTGVHDIMVAYVVNDVAAKPVQRHATYQAFLQHAVTVVRGLEQGTLPDSIPYHSIPPGDRAEAKRVLIQTGKLDARNPEHAKAIAMLEQAVDEDRVDVAFKVSVLGVLDPVIAAATQKLTNNPLVHTETTDQGARYILTPPASVTSKLEGKLAIAQTAGVAAGWARLAGLGLLMLGAVGMMWLFWTDKRAGLRWLGGPLVVTGTLGFVAWLVARAVVSNKVEAVIAGNKGLPPSLRKIMTDVSTSAIGDMTPSVWVPSLVLVGFGAAALVLSFRVLRAVPGGAFVPGHPGRIGGAS